MEVGLPGGYGFYGVADVLSGEVNPSGHLADTYAVDNSSSPAAQNYGNYEWTNADSAYSINSEIVEAEGIYTGYKYYETRYADTVLGQGNASDKTGSSNGKAWNYEDEVSYPFGYGLSYTTFSQTLDSLDVNLEDKTVTAKVTVKNIGDVAGKDVVQLYTSLPYTEYDKEHAVEKAAVQLMKKQVCCSRENLLLSRLRQMLRIWQAGTAHVTMRREQKETGSWMQETIILQSEMVLMRRSTMCWQHRV